MRALAAQARGVGGWRGHIHPHDNRHRGGAQVGVGLINGFREGGVQVAVLLGWTVKWNWVCATARPVQPGVVGSEREKLPERARIPAFECDDLKCAHRTGPGQGRHHLRGRPVRLVLAVLWCPTTRSANGSACA
jgi:hypothetical protein